MRIAVLFSGRINRYKEHYENIKMAIGQDHEIHFFLSHSPECDENLDEFDHIYQPKTLNNHPIHYLDVSNYKCHPASNSHNMMCMWYNRWRVFTDMQKYMVATGVWYDLVICSRLDIWCYQLLDYNLFDPSKLTDQGVYVPEGHDWGGLNDQMAIGTYYAMEKYMTLYTNMKEILDELMISLGTYGPEPVLKTHMVQQGMTVHRFHLDYRLINGKLYHKP
jgi:hypothetical protein